MTSTAFRRALRAMGFAGQKSGGVMFYPFVILHGDAPVTMATR
jgi:hypothetical protein